MIESDFLWAVGIEDTFVSQPHRRTGRQLDEYELTQHYQRWRTDLGLAASLGVSHVRYGIPWHRVNPERGRFDWSWTDEVLDHLVCDLRLEPIVDLMHYGCPAWLTGEFVSPDYSARVAEYTAAFVERYRGLTRMYTPLNEPLVNARFCGYVGAWPPYLRGWRGWTTVLMGLVEGMSQSIATIRSLQPEAQIVHVEACSSLTTDDVGLQPALEAMQARDFLPTDLLLGRVGPDHELFGWLRAHGASEQRLDELLRSPSQIDLLGVNFYPTISCWRLVQREGRPIPWRWTGGAPELTATLRLWHDRYGLPVMVTETSRGGRPGSRGRWMDESIAAVRALIEDGLPIGGYTWFPLFSLLAWSYRAGSRDAREYLMHMGLWDLRDDGAGGLERRPTALVGRYRRHIDGGGVARQRDDSVVCPPPRHSAAENHGAGASIAELAAVRRPQRRMNRSEPPSRRCRQMTKSRFFVKRGRSHGVYGDRH